MTRAMSPERANLLLAEIETTLRWYKSRPTSDHGIKVICSAMVAAWLWRDSGASKAQWLKAVDAVWRDVNDLRKKLGEIQKRVVAEPPADSGVRQDA